MTGDVAPLEVARSGTSDFSTNAELNSGNRIIVTDHIPFVERPFQLGVTLG